MTSAMDRQISPPWWQSRRMVVLGVIGVVVLGLAAVGLAFGANAKRSLRVPIATVTINTVQRGVFRDVTPLIGSVTPHDTVDLAALEGGQVERVMVEAGDVVSKDQPLVVFRNTQLELDVLDREGRLIESITQLQAYEKQLEDTRLANEKALADIDYNITRLSRSAERRDRLATQGAESTEAREKVHDELEHYRELKPLQADSIKRQEALRRSQLPQIREQLDGLQKSLRITRSKLENLVLKAPVDGQLNEFNINVGQNFNRGERLGQIVPDTGVKVSASVDEYYLGRIQVGQIASTQIDGRDWSLHVTRVYPQVKDRNFTIDLAFEKKTPEGLQPGRTITGTLSMGGDQPALLLSNGPFLSQTGGSWVMVLESDRRAERRPVRLGRRNAEQIEIVSGLAEGDRVITSDYGAFESIDRVDLTN